jgi:hypothetical protein
VPVVYVPMTLVATARIGPETNGNGGSEAEVSPAQGGP